MISNFVIGQRYNTNIKSAKKIEWGENTCVTPRYSIRENCFRKCENNETFHDDN